MFLAACGDQETAAPAAPVAQNTETPAAATASAASNAKHTWW